MGGSLALIVFVVVMISVLVGTTFLWVVAAVAMIALVGLIVVMAHQKKFVGPRVVADDLRQRFEALGRDDDDEEVEEVVLLRKEPHQ